MATISRRQKICRDAADGRKCYEKDGDLEARFPGETDKSERPEEIELLFETEGPQVAEDFSGRMNVVVPGIKGRAEKASQVNVLNVEDAAEPDNCEEGVKGGQNPEGSADIKVANADFAGLCILFEKKIGDEITANDKESGNSEMAVAQRKEKIPGVSGV
jgi:hypothetical protein